ncbi:MAG: AAA family ATPase, partial [Sciscionella sp.]
MDAAQRSVLELLGDRVLDDENLPEQVAELVLAAFEGEQQLGAAIRGEPAAHATERPACGGTAPEVYLGAIHAEGFRGVGPAAVLRLQPGPGLTLVTGRNGSGKSSFAEAAELVLTGANKRWSGRTSVWREGWRNLHNDGSAMIAVDLVTAGEPGVLTLRRDWAVDDDLDAGTSTMQRAGEKRLPLSAPEWTAALETYRPFLSYSELGALIDGKPSELYDALYRLLGLDALTEAQKTLRDQHKRLQDAARRMQESRRALAVDLAEVDDERARRAATLLARQRADLTAIANLALGSDRDATELTALRAIATMRMPDGEAVTAATTRLRQSIAAAAESSTETAATASSTAELLRAAMRHRDGHDETCPVCRIGMLDERWQAEAERRAGELERAATRLRTAAADVATALASAKGLVTTTPQALRHAPAGLDITGAHELWQRWEATLAVTEPAAVADALDAVFAELAPVVAETIRA